MLSDSLFLPRPQALPIVCRSAETAAREPAGELSRVLDLSRSDGAESFHPE
jgi:hypothetical protein